MGGTGRLRMDVTIQLLQFFLKFVKCHSVLFFPL
jgi:hypothetical protein